jgi:hypothetical protein
MAGKGISERLEALDWADVEETIRLRGHFRSRPILRPAECRALIARYDDDSVFRSRVVMGRHNFGAGDYAYFAEPLPDLVAALQAGLYAGLAPIANRMMAELGRAARYPPGLAAYRRRCRAAGQSKPTPLLLRYGPGGHNRLHRDLYGEHVFPLQVMAMLSRPERDFDGGAFLLVENRPRQQSLGEALTPVRGELVIFPVNERPVEGRRGVLRATVRHGVSRIEAGERFTLGIIFHDAA